MNAVVQFIGFVTLHDIKIKGFIYNIMSQSIYNRFRLTKAQVSGAQVNSFNFT